MYLYSSNGSRSPNRSRSLRSPKKTTSYCNYSQLGYDLLQTTLTRHSLTGSQYYRWWLRYGYWCGSLHSRLA